ncbi:AraC family transcriptional regulator [Gloeocapsopsis dulcis]|uniref:AraC family transcriptional regulator n=1 Tax=Gloeocapsopsis dulcis AAB1 = 1H9 TaxID=1433147 RepID=A0A6N8FTN6_9CHRO|nr:AraC family transcriptional regulator [Gloeocapsopsis dulcis]MUL35942.1 AraC family transcriptional regulator [Gloeocapsopsis dulcis AAB1 = 1H9]WNN88197.1 AraC family transcriptional regulator [Gloeocapsopsis dulcis]
MKAAAKQEKIKFWREEVALSHLELLHARYITHSFSRHAHETFAIGVIEQGAEAFSYQGEKHIAPAGSVVVINPGEVHTGSAANIHVGWTYRMLYPDIKLLQQATSEAGQQTSEIPYFPIAVIQDSQLARLILKLHHTLEKVTCTLEQDSCLLWTLAQLIARHAGERLIWRVGKESQAVLRVQEYLEAHYTKNISLDAIARIANLSPFYLIRTFRKCIGLPPHEYLTQIRISRAKILLLQGYAIAQVAHDTGFADQSHLTRHFKRIVGVTPGQYQHIRQ